MALEKVTPQERAARDKELLTLLRKWRGLEDLTIKSCTTILNKTKNPIVATLTTAIKNDSEKHKAILQLIIDGMTKKGFVLTPEDLADVASLVDKHIDLEQRSIETAEKAVELSRDTIVKQMLKTILDDEKRHEKMAVQMNELKFRITGKIT
ncbi:MAG: hypothetical protein K8I29_13115 [Alphaproteobacteria bacterium]|uniref:Ferritin-like domain-containing protein n=1 Tax=Candidatus Nitrobium versatile TaxID=2884831 RepID=A0A953JCN9_9BACT|nr:hypothetical protein [Candidatus Nitrobium versatile]